MALVRGEGRQRLLVMPTKIGIPGAADRPRWRAGVPYAIARHPKGRAADGQIVAAFDYAHAVPPHRYCCAAQQVRIAASIALAWVSRAARRRSAQGDRALAS